MDTEYLKRVGIYIVSAILSLGIIVYFGYHLWRSFAPEVSTEAISETTITKTLPAQGFIFRDEAVLECSAAGGLVPSVRDGEKLGVGGEAAKIYSAVLPEASARINELDEQIALLEECTGDTTVTLKDAARFDGELYDIMSEIRAALNRGSAEAASGLRSALISATNKKMILTEGAADIEAQLSALRTELAEQKALLGSCLETVKSPRSGYYFSAADGYESIFTTQLLADCNYSALRELTEKTAAAPANSAGKLAFSNEWYCVCFIEGGASSLMEQGETRSVSFDYNGGVTLEMTLTRLLRGEDGYACVFRCENMPEGFDYTRSQPVKISLTEYTGFKVRMSAVRVLGEYTGVYVLDGSTVKFRRIMPVTEYENSYIVETSPEEESGDYEWLRLHDLLICEGTGLYDGRILGK